MNVQGHRVIVALVCGVALLVAGGALAVDKAPTIELVPGALVPATDGAQMYAVYCAQCHAGNGGGNGPLAGHFTTCPSDLTLLSAANGGRFPRQHVVGTLLAGHAQAPDESAMPNWRAALMPMDRDNPERAFVRARHLADHIETLQRGAYTISAGLHD